MAGRLWASLLIGLLASAASTADAYENRGVVDVRTRDNGVDTSIEVGRPGSAGGGAVRASGCTWTSAAFDFGDVLAGRREMPAIGPAASPEHVLHDLYCDGAYRGTRWIGPREPVPVDATVERLVRRLEAHASGIDVRPDADGVTGVTSYFWISAPPPVSLTDHATLGATTVAVAAALTGVRWDFGDGAVVEGGLGEPWPQRSSVRHNYAVASGDTPYTVTATLRFTPTFAVDGGAPQPLAPFEVTTSRPYRVRQVQAVRNR